MWNIDGDTMNAAKKEIKKISKKGGGILEKRSKGEKILFTIAFCVLLIHSLTLIFPVLWMLMSSFKGALEYMGDMGTIEIFYIPKKWLAGDYSNFFGNYADAFQVLNKGNTTFFGMILNSVWYTLIRTACGVFIPAATGYVMSKYRFPGWNVIFSIAIISMIIPIVGNTASKMQILAVLKLINTPVFVFVDSLGGFGGTFLVFYGFFKALSWSYAEAVMIDGGGHYTIFFKIMLPQAAPILLTYAITGSIDFWNEYEPVILFLNDYPTLASGLFEYQDDAIRLSNYPIYFAGLLISIIPTLLIFGIFSDRIMTSVSIGGLKG